MSSDVSMPPDCTENNNSQCTSSMASIGVSLPASVPPDDEDTLQSDDDEHHPDIDLPPAVQEDCDDDCSHPPNGFDMDHSPDFDDEGEFGEAADDLTACNVCCHGSWYVGGHRGACWFFGVALCGRGSFLFTVSSVDAHGFVSAWFGFALEPWGLLSSQSTATSLWDCSASAIRRVSAGSLRARILLPGLHERRRRPVRRLQYLLYSVNVHRSSRA